MKNFSKDFSKIQDDPDSNLFKLSQQCADLNVKLLKEFNYNFDELIVYTFGQLVSLMSAIDRNEKPNTDNN